MSFFYQTLHQIERADIASIHEKHSVIHFDIFHLLLLFTMPSIIAKIPPLFTLKKGYSKPCFYLSKNNLPSSKKI